MPSTVIQNFSYNSEDNSLQIRFVTGLVYEYSSVPPAVYEAMKASKAKGIFFNRHVKDKYAFRKLSE